MAQLKTQFVVSGWWSSPARSGIHVEAAITRDAPPANWERNRLEILEALFAAAPLSPTASLEAIATQAFGYLQQLGGGVQWVRCSEGPCSVIKILEPD